MIFACPPRLVPSTPLGRTEGGAKERKPLRLALFSFFAVLLSVFSL
ncbi:lytic murein transglycosylase, partial [Mesorhizobium sp. M7A.F.Ca.US.007.01.1.1]